MPFSQKMLVAAIFVLGVTSSPLLAWAEGKSGFGVITAAKEECGDPNSWKGKLCDQAMTMMSKFYAGTKKELSAAMPDLSWKRNNPPTLVFFGAQPTDGEIADFLEKLDPSGENGLLRIIFLDGRDRTYNDLSFVPAALETTKRDLEAYLKDSADFPEEKVIYNPTLTFTQEQGLAERWGKEFARMIHLKAPQWFGYAKLFVSCPPPPGFQNPRYSDQTQRQANQYEDAGDFAKSFPIKLSEKIEGHSDFGRLKFPYAGQFLPYSVVNRQDGFSLDCSSSDAISSAELESLEKSSHITLELAVTYVSKRLTTEIIQFYQTEDSDSPTEIAKILHKKAVAKLNRLAAENFVNQISICLMKSLSNNFPNPLASRTVTVTIDAAANGAVTCKE